MSKALRLTCYATSPTNVLAASDVRRGSRFRNVSDGSDASGVDQPDHHAGCSFCKCWMPEWFRLAEIVGEERRTAGCA